jgi:hypothetical protein
MSPRTAEHITWHQSHDAVDRVMVHPSDGEAWKHFNSVHPHFLAESRNVCLGLCTDGFNPFGSIAAPYSCWPVILAIYNLPSKMCMRLVFMFLSMVIPGPSNPRWNIDVCLRPLIDELTQLWSSRALTYDIVARHPRGVGWRFLFITCVLLGSLESPPSIMVTRNLWSARV